MALALVKEVILMKMLIMKSSRIWNRSTSLINIHCDSIAYVNFLTWHQICFRAEKEQSSDEFFRWEEDAPGYFEDGGGGDIMEEDRKLLSMAADRERSETTTVRPAHRRHLHKHPYDRGPKLKPAPN